VKFSLPVGHTPTANRAQEGQVLSGPPEADPLLPVNIWTYRKVKPDYGLPLDDGDLQPGNGVAISVHVDDNPSTDKLVPSIDSFKAKIRVPPAVAPVPFDATNPFGTAEFIPCKQDA
jgi:hypothetical protein